MRNSYSGLERYAKSYITLFFQLIFFIIGFDVEQQ